MSKHMVAVLLDGGHVLFELTGGAIKKQPEKLPTTKEILDLAYSCIIPEKEEIFRIYYYDCEPYSGKPRHPVSNRPYNYQTARTYIMRSTFYDKLAQEKNIAFRSGQLKFRGWNLKKSALTRLIKSSGRIEESDMVPNFQQKGVDIKIGLDISWLASKKVVDRIILFTGDTDFIPAMKFARREGVQVILAALRDNIKTDLKKHSDEFRLSRMSKQADS